MCLLICNQVLQNRSLNCSCPWDCHARRLYLRDDPKSHFKKDCTVLFRKNKTVEIFFGRFRFWKTLVRGLLCVEMQTAWQRWVWILPQRYLRVYQKQNLALSRFKKASTLSSKCECWCEFEKDFEVFRYSFPETIPLFCIRLSTNIVNVSHSKVPRKFELKCTSHGGMYGLH